MDWVKITARGDKKHLSLGVWCDLYKWFYGNMNSMEDLVCCKLIPGLHITTNLEHGMTAQLPWLEQNSAAITL